MRTRGISVLLFVLTATTLGAGCIESPEPTEATKNAEKVDCSEASSAERVKIGGFGNHFEPHEVTVEQGEAVEWYVASDADHEHSVNQWRRRFQEGSFESGPLEVGDTYCMQFPEAGEMKYYCKEDDLTGRVVVE